MSKVDPVGGSAVRWGEVMPSGNLCFFLRRGGWLKRPWGVDGGWKGEADFGAGVEDSRCGMMGSFRRDRGVEM